MSKSERILCLEAQVKELNCILIGLKERISKYWYLLDELEKTQANGHKYKVEELWGDYRDREAIKRFKKEGC